MVGFHAWYVIDIFHIEVRPKETVQQGTKNLEAQFHKNIPLMF